jgi:ABC-2 type transport system ATP-binding protein
MTAMIEVRDFRKTFLVGLRRRRQEAARRIGFEVARGEIFGFLGPNGAGKTTTIKALLGLIRPDGGSLSLLGHPVDSMAWRARVGYMPEHPNFYEYLSAFEMVVWFARLSGLVRAEAEQEARRLLERVGLAAAMHRRLRSYSKGMLQRAGLAQAMVARPELLILDEPMTGLDPIGRREVRELILELRQEGKTIFYSTHILPDVEMTCDRVSIIHRGETLRTGRLVDILEETHRGVLVVMRDVSAAQLERVRAAHPGAKLADAALEVVLDDLDAARALVADLTAGGATLARFEQYRADLESIFLETLGARGGPGEPA